MISLIVPSRGRPQRFEQMWQSAVRTALEPIEVITYLDFDDETRAKYPVYGTQIVGSRTVLSQAWNIAAAQANGDMLMMAGDDLIFHTYGWDTIAKQRAWHYPDEIALIHTNDGYQNEQLATHPIVTRRWVEVVGTLCPPYFTADYNDVWLHEVASAVGRRIYCPDIYIEHVHPDAGKIETDLTYQEQRLRRYQDDMPRVYESYAVERQEWISKLVEAMWAQEPTNS